MLPITTFHMAMEKMQYEMLPPSRTDCIALLVSQLGREREKEAAFRSAEQGIALMEFELGTLLVLLHKSFRYMIKPFNCVVTCKMVEKIRKELHK